MSGRSDTPREVVDRREKATDRADPANRTEAAYRAEAAYRRMLVLLPRRFRHEAENELIDVFRDGWAAARRTGRPARFWARTAADLLWTAAAERVRPSPALPHDGVSRASTPSTGSASMDDLRAALSAELSDRRLLLAVTLAFGTLALVLSGVGVYSVVSFSVRRRLREAAIRMSLGARPGEVSRTVLAQGVVPALAGVALGLVVAVPATAALGSQLFQVGRFDPVVFAGATAFLSVVAVLAGWWPSRQAGRVDPADALQVE